MHHLGRSLTRPGIWWVGVAAWFLILFILSSQPKVPSDYVTFSDKVLHFGYFAAGSTGFFLALRLQIPPFSPPVATALTILFAGLVGWFDEWHQSFTYGRSGNDLGDWIADITGGAFACLVGAYLHRQLRKRDKVGSKSEAISSNL